MQRPSSTAAQTVNREMPFMAAVGGWASDERGIDERRRERGI